MSRDASSIVDCQQDLSLAIGGERRGPDPIFRSIQLAANVCRYRSVSLHVGHLSIDARGHRLGESFNLERNEVSLGLLDSRFVLQLSLRSALHLDGVSGHANAGKSSRFIDRVVVGGPDRAASDLLLTGPLPVPKRIPRLAAVVLDVECRPSCRRVRKPVADEECCRTQIDSSQRNFRSGASGMTVRPGSAKTMSMIRYLAPGLRDGYSWLRTDDGDYTSSLSSAMSSVSCSAAFSGASPKLIPSARAHCTIELSRVTRLI